MFRCKKRVVVFLIKKIREAHNKITPGHNKITRGHNKIEKADLCQEVIFKELIFRYGNFKR